MRLAELKKRGSKTAPTRTKHTNDDLLAALKVFLPLVKKSLGLTDLPKINFVKSLTGDDQPSFGSFCTATNTIDLSIENRHPVDILRTLAHELVHYKQKLQNKLNKNSGKTGSSIENQANVLAGNIMRAFNKKYSKYLEKEPVNFD
jgi:hypothetical protein